MGTSYNTNIVTDGLAACWDAGNRRSYPGAGTTWTDLAGGIKGTLENEDDDALNFNSFKGGYLEFDGTDGRVLCGDAGVENELIVDWGELSVCVWALAIQSSHSSYGLVFIGGNPFQLSIAPPAHQRFIWATIDGTSLTADVGCLDPYWGKWAHYAVRWVTGTDNYRLYINGEVIKTGTFNDTHISRGSNDPLYLACRIKGSSVKNFEGNMGSVYIYDRALSDDEIKQNYEATKSRFAPRITKEGLMYYVDAGDPLCYDGNLANYYAPGTYNLRDLAEGAIGEFNGMNSQYPFFVNANGGYWELDGTDDNICPFSGSSGTPYSRYTSANGITGMMWINLAEDSTNIFFWKDDTFQFRYDNSNKLNMRSGNGTSWSTSADLKSAADLLAADGTEWACVAALANKSNDAREIWLNGERVANDTGSGMVWGTNNNIMGVADSSLGDVAMALLYERALSAAEIKDFYNKTKARFGH